MAYAYDYQYLKTKALTLAKALDPSETLTKLELQDATHDLAMFLVEVIDTMDSRLDRLERPDAEY